MSISTEITRLQTAKADLKTAIEGKGVTVPSATKIDGYADLVESIETGGGGDITPYLNIIARDGSITKLADPNIIRVGFAAFYNWSGITEVTLPNCTQISGQSFMNSANILLFHLPKLETITESLAFNGASKSTGIIVFPMLNTYPTNQAFGGFKGSIIDLGENITDIFSFMFYNNSNLNTLILRKKTISALNNVNAFQNSPFASGGTGGTLYVPQSLITSYQAATNWSTILGYANNSIQAIEGSTYETQYADGTPISA